MEITPKLPFNRIQMDSAANRDGINKDEQEVPVRDTVSQDAAQAEEPSLKPILKKPDITQSQEITSTETITAAQDAVPAETAVAASSIAVSGPVGSALAEQLKMLTTQNVDFYLKRRFHIPKLVEPYKAISPEKATKLLSGSSKKSPVHASVEKGSLVHISGKNELDELAAFKGKGDPSLLRNRDLAEFLKRASSEFLISTDDGKAKKAFGVYRYVMDSTGEKKKESPHTVSFYYKKALVLTVTPQQLNDIKKCEDTLQAAKEAHKELGGNSRLVEEVMKPPHGASFKVSSDILKGFMRHSREYENDEKRTPWEIAQDEMHWLRDNCSSGAEFEKLGTLYIRLLDAWNVNSLQEPLHKGFEFIKSRLQHDPDEFGVFTTMLYTSNYSDAFRFFPGYAGEFARPVHDETYQERLKAYSNHLSNFYGRGQGLPQEAFKDYKVIARNLDATETLQQGFDRFTLLHKAIKTSGYANHDIYKNFLDETRDMFSWINKEQQKKSFGSTSAEFITGMLTQVLSLGTKPDDARSMMIFRYGKKDVASDGGVIADDNVIDIGGIKLGVKKYFSHILHRK